MTEENIRIIRPGYGLKPKYFKDILGLRTDRELKRGEPVTFDVLKKGAVLFLTNNENTEELFQWLKAKEPLVYKLTNKLTAEMAEQLQPSFVVSFNYRHLISEDVLEILKGRIINLHISLLPYNRGSAPNFFSFLEDTPKGVTIHQMEKGLDTGDILCRREMVFDEARETFESTYDKLLAEMMRLFRENWEDIKAGRIVPQKQIGPGTCHTMSELEEIRKKHPFVWSDNIAAYKNRLKGSENL